VRDVNPVVSDVVYGLLKAGKLLLDNDQRRSMGAAEQREYLYACVRNAIFRRARADRRAPRPLAGDAEDVAEDSVLPDRSPSPYAIAEADNEKEWRLALLRRCVERLPALQRVVFDLRAKGMSNVEIASKLGKEHGNVRFAFHAAIRRLRELVNAS
jgi:RNA polymerase sigma factor (sigma-70 family)